MPIDVVDIQAKVRISGKVIARNMSYDTFMDTDFGERHVEWVNGLVIEMAGIDERHDALVDFLRIFFSAFLESTGGGRCLGDPMLMKLIDVPSLRTPDIQVLLPDRLGQITIPTTQ
ncbi:MAG: Uma2 family endonuclease [Chloroflexi bacterium]|nr:Uma2 family endonuclease [Chloroflexota bacterium]MCC6892555.1 Uma2 family endonuclease [Anaerolineae bacterium]